MKRMDGFTLIELMIVVAIVGVLAAIALPQYLSYAVRAKMTEGEAALAACKTSISEYVSTKGEWPKDAADAGCDTTTTQYVESLSVSDQGVISVKTQNTKAAPDECTLILTPQGTPTAITAWIGSHTGCDSKYVPSNFRS